MLKISNSIINISSSEIYVSQQQIKDISYTDRTYLRKHYKRNYYTLEAFVLT